MRFINLTLHNFKSFAGDHEFNLDRPHGLYFLKGDNKSEPRLGANGAGKSTIWDALFWTLYGKTLRGLKASNVRTWWLSGCCETAVDFVKDDIDYRIARSWNPNALILIQQGGPPRTVTQDELEELLGLGPDEFENSFIIGQFSQMFFDLAPAPKLALFSDIMGLQYWMDCSADASIQVKKLDQDVHEIELEISSLDGRLEQAEEALETSRRLHLEFKKLTASSLLEQQDCLEQSLVNLTTSKEHLGKHTSTLSGYEKTITGLEKQIEKLMHEKQIQGDQLHIAQNKKNSADVKLEGIENDLCKFDGVQDTCPFCKQTVSKTHIRKEVAKLQKRKDKLDAEHDKYIAQEDDYKQILAKTRDDLMDLNDEIKPQRRKLITARETVQEIKLDVQRDESDIDKHKENIKRIKAEKNPYRDQIDSDMKVIAGLKKSRKESNEELKDTLTDLEGTKFWVRGFKDLRLFLVEEALLMLEVEVNNCLIQLGLINWEVKFDVERETKSGTVSKGFQVLIRSPDNDDLVPWEAWSGGEGQRLRLGGTMGLANLILQRKGITSNLQIWDEPSQHLSTEGLEDLVDLLAQRAQTLNQQIFLVDHASYDYGGFEAVFCVEKGRDGSQIVTEVGDD